MCYSTFNGPKIAIFYRLEPNPLYIWWSTWRIERLHAIAIALTGMKLCISLYTGMFQTFQTRSFDVVNRWIEDKQCTEAVNFNLCAGVGICCSVSVEHADSLRTFMHALLQNRSYRREHLILAIDIYRALLSFAACLGLYTFQTLSIIWNCIAICLNHGGLIRSV